MENNKMKLRIENIDILRGIAILLMVMGHIGFTGYFDRYIHMFHMPIWFFISGWLFKDNEESISKIISKKFKALIVPYLIWGLLQYPIWIILNKQPKHDIFEPLINLLWINTNELMPIAGALWFLTCLFFAECTFILLKRTIKNKRVFCLFIAVGVVFGNIFTSLFNFRLPWAIDTSFVAVGFLYLGHIFRIYSNRKSISYLLSLPKWVCFILFLVSGVMGFVNGYINMRIGMYGFIPLFWINALTSIIVYWNVSKYIYEHQENNIFKIVTVWTKRMGQNSILYLCLNQLVILCFTILMNWLFSNMYWLIKNILILIGTLITLLSLDYAIMHTKLRVLFGKRFT